MSLSEQTAAAWLGAVQTARGPKRGQDHGCVLVDAATVLAVDAERVLALGDAAELRRHVEALEGALRVNARMLARQCDLARDAETREAAANKRAEKLEGHLTTAERDLALALNAEENLRQALISAGHDPECPIVWGALDNWAQDHDQCRLASWQGDEVGPNLAREALGLPKMGGG